MPKSSQDNMRLVDVNCGRMIPVGNLNPNVAGSYGYMRRELDQKQRSSRCFHAGTSSGFTPGYTTKGLSNVPWGFATF